MTPKSTLPHARVQSEANPESSLGLERLVFFSDAIIAIAITLLVLDIRIPEPAVSQESLVTAIRGLLPHFMAFFISFFVIGLYWLSHHRIFGHIRRYDRGLLWINLIFLFLIACVPVPTALLGRYGSEPLAVQLYAATMAILALVRTGLWIYALKHNLTEPNLPAQVRRYEILVGLLSALVFGVSMIVAQFNPLNAMTSWILVSVISAIARRDQRKAA